ncbi:MAG: helix-turn-helix transcriptional regulator [Thermodesulfobacteriota bacterium]
MTSITPIKLELAEKLERDKGFRERFFRGQAQDEIAMSIRVLRGKRNLRQIDLAEESDMKQSAVSRIEQAEYSAWSFNTLFRIADALDARLKIVFEPTEEVVEQYKQKEADAEAQFEQRAPLHTSDATKTEVEGPSKAAPSPPSICFPRGHGMAMAAN